MFPNRATKAHVIVFVDAMELIHEGLYDFVVFANGQEIDRQKFRAVKFEEADDGQSEAADPGEG
jgi:hypothetical protein